MNRRGFFKLLGALGLTALVGSQVKQSEEPVTSGYARVEETPKEVKFFYDEYAFTTTASSEGYFYKDSIIVIRKKI